MSLRSGIIFALLGIVFGVFESTMRSFLPAPFSGFSIVFPFLVILLAFEQPRLAYVVASTAGFSMDLFSIESTTLAFVRCILFVFIIAYVSIRLLTNQSLYAAIAMILFAQVFDWVWLLAFGYNAFENMRNVGWVLLWDVVVVGSVFFIGTILMNRFVGSKRNDAIR